MVNNDPQLTLPCDIEPQDHIELNIDQQDGSMSINVREFDKNENTRTICIILTKENSEKLLHFMLNYYGGMSAKVLYGKS